LALKWRYGLTERQLEALKQIQNGKCAICGNPPTGKRMTLFVDHCHSKKVVRGLLCNHCNTGLGYFRDDPKLMERAIQYLSGIPLVVSCGVQSAQALNVTTPQNTQIEPKPI
jgi:hypothetical protein